MRVFFNFCNVAVLVLIVIVALGSAKWQRSPWLGSYHHLFLMLANTGNSLKI